MAKVRKKTTGNLTALKNDILTGIDKKLKRFATKSDLWQLEERIDGLEEKINRLPTKNEFYTSMDKLMSEIETMRQENIISTDMKRQVNKHEERLETVEEKLGIRILAA